MKTPEEIKKGLECCHVGGCECDECTYRTNNSCMHWLKQDALAYIQHLESRLAQVERERDAVVRDLRHAADCDTCKHQIFNGAWYVSNECLDCSHGCNYEWRGVCPENTKED